MSGMLRLLEHLATCEVEEKLSVVLDDLLGVTVNAILKKGIILGEAHTRKAEELLKEVAKDRLGFAMLVMKDPERSGLAFVLAVATLSFRPEGIRVLGKTYSTDASGRMTVLPIGGSEL